MGFVNERLVVKLIQTETHKVPHSYLTSPTPSTVTASEPLHTIKPQNRQLRPTQRFDRQCGRWRHKAGVVARGNNWELKINSTIGRG
jgi:hypothetical protein